MIEEKRLVIQDIPCINITCGSQPKGVVLFYHGWTSAKELQSVRGRILAAYGYDVLIPDAINHGERGPIDYDNPVAYSAFWQTIFQNVDEGKVWIEYMKKAYPGLPYIVMGHSMGGFTTLGLMSRYADFTTAVAMNGSGWWDESERHFRAALWLDKPSDYPQLMEKLAALDPYTHTDHLIGKSVLSLDGGADHVVHKAAEKLYMEKLKRLGIDSKMIVYESLDHFVTTNMMGDAIQWIDAHLQ